MLIVHNDNTTCGVFHISGFHGSPKALIYNRYRVEKNLLKRREKGNNYESTSAEQLFDDVLNTLRTHSTVLHTGENACKVVRCCLTDSQIKSNPGWASVLKTRGFKLVTRFLNTSGNWNNLFDCVLLPEARDDKKPDWWEGE